MRNTAFAFKDEYDEVPVSSTESLERNVIAVHESLNSFKVEVRAAIVGLSDEIKVVRGEVKELRGELKEMRGVIESFRKDVNDQLSALRKHVDDQISTLRTEVNAEFKSLREKMDRNFERLSGRIDATNKEVAELGKTVVRVDTKLNAVGWVLAGLAALAGLLAMVNKALHWF